ncbi:MAG: MaoC family dehydratase N-terminal domain-containing protein [Dehalococcoidia bacterium]
MPDDMVDDESMITPAMEAAIGKTGKPITVEINRELVVRMADAIEEDDPELRAVLKSDEPNPIVPHWAMFTAYARLRQERVPDTPNQGLMAADEMWMLAPLRVGDRITIVPRVADIQERIGGRVGHSLFVHHEWTYTNQDGVEVARSRRTITHFKRRHTGESQ